MLGYQLIYRLHCINHAFFQNGQLAIAVIAICTVVIVVTLFILACRFYVYWRYVISSCTLHVFNNAKRRDNDVC